MEQKYRGVLAYFFGWIGGVLILLLLNYDNDDQTKFHCCQAIVITVIGQALTLMFMFIPYFEFIGYMFGTAMLVIVIIGMIRAYNDQEFEIPGISNLTRNIFKGILNK